MLCRQEQADEAKATEENKRIASIKAEAEARQAARKARWAEQQAEKKRKDEAGSSAAVATSSAAAAAVSEGDGWDGEMVVPDTSRLPSPKPATLSDAACRERRCVRVDNVGYQSSEDDVRMLMEGFGRINAIHAIGGVYAIEYANSLSAEDACSERAIGSHKGSVLAGRQLSVTALNSAVEAKLPKQGQPTS